MRSRKVTLTATAVAVALLTASCSNDASDNDDYEASGTIKMLVSMAAGGGSDRAARVLSSALNENADGYNTVVENREGGGGAVGWTYFYGLEGEPNHLVKAETAIHTLPLQDGVEVPWTYDDFTPIALFAEDSRMVVAPGDSPFNSCADLIDGSQEVLAGVSGTYGIDGMVLQYLDEAGMSAERVPFGSTGEVITGLLGGKIDIAPVGPAAAKQYIESGDMKGLCTFSEDPYSADDVLKDVPTAKEDGIDATVAIWRGFLAPPEISESAQNFWIDEFKKAVETDEYKQYIEDDLLIEKQLYGDEFGAYLDEYDEQINQLFG